MHVLELSEASAVRIHQVHTIVARLRRKRLSFDPSTHQRRDLVSANRSRIEAGVGLAQCVERRKHGAAGPQMSRPQRILGDS